MKDYAAIRQSVAKCYKEAAETIEPGSYTGKPAKARKK